MTYQDYFKQADFEDIWAVLSGFYLEDERLKPKYEKLVEEINTMPVIESQSTEKIKMVLDCEYEIMVMNAPDPQEWLVGREVTMDFDFRDFYDIQEKQDNVIIPIDITFDCLTDEQKRQVVKEGDSATIAAHLLYWSTLYNIKSHAQHVKEFIDYFKQIETGMVVRRSKEEKYEARSRYRKHRKYWRDTVAHDSAIDWTPNLDILQKKLEYNIGYWRYVQRHVGGEEDVKRMQTACRLIEIIGTSYLNIDGKYINTRTASRYTKETDWNPNDKMCHQHYLRELYQDKAFNILWKFLDHNMKNWWD